MKKRRRDDRRKVKSIYRTCVDCGRDVHRKNMIGPVCKVCDQKDQKKGERP